MSWLTDIVELLGECRYRASARREPICSGASCSRIQPASPAGPCFRLPGAIAAEESSSALPASWLTKPRAQYVLAGREVQTGYRAGVRDGARWRTIH